MCSMFYKWNLSHRDTMNEIKLTVVSSGNLAVNEITLQEKSLD